MPLTLVEKVKIYDWLRSGGVHPLDMGDVEYAILYLKGDEFDARMLALYVASLKRQATNNELRKE